MKLSVRIAVAAVLAAAATAARAQTPAGEALRINGYLSVEFERMVSSAGKGDANGSLDADLFDLVLNWRGLEKVRLAADLTWEHGAATENGYGNVGVEYAWAEYAAADWLKLRAGKMFTPFGIYNEIHTAKPVYLSVKEPLSTNKIEKFGAGDLRFYPRWGVGLAALGRGVVPFGEWDYVVAVTNGTDSIGLNPYEESDNHPLAVTARVRLLTLEKLEVGASAYWDAITETTTDPTTEKILPTPYRTNIFSYGAQATWNARHDGPGAELEVVAGSVSPSTQSGLADYSRLGGTAMVWWQFAERFTPYARVEYFDPNRDVKDDVAMLYLGGVNVRVVDALFFKAEADVIRAGDANERFAGGQGKYTEVKAAVVLGF